MSVINDLSGDQRIHRIASALVEGGFEVLVVGRKLPNSIPLSDRPYQAHRMRLFFTKGKWFYLEYNFRLFWFLLFHRADILNANDLDTLLANFLVSKLRGRRLIYDSHEYFTEVPELIHRKLTRSIWLKLEAWIFPKLTQVYTVNGSLSKIYSEKYKKNVKIIRNVPFSQKQALASGNEKIIIYQGALNMGRGIDLMIKSMEFLPGFKLWIIGRGDLEEELRKLAQDQQFPERIDFKGFVPMEKLFTYTSKALIGLSLEEDLGANYRYSSPNKVYDYIQAGVPVLVANLPEMRMIIEQYQVGEFLNSEERDPEQLAKRITQIAENKEKCHFYRQKCLKAREELNWGKEKDKLLEIYSD